MLAEQGEEMGMMVDVVDKFVEDAEMKILSLNTGVFFLNSGKSSLGRTVRFVAGSRVEPNELV